MSERANAFIDALFATSDTGVGRIVDHYIDPGGLARMRCHHRYLPLVGLVALTHAGCATPIAERHPHLDRRSVCVLPPQIENDAALMFSPRTMCPFRIFTRRS